LLAIKNLAVRRLWVSLRTPTFIVVCVGVRTSLQPTS